MPQDSLVVIYNPSLKEEYCVGVVTGEKEVATPAVCASSGENEVAVCTDLKSCVQDPEDSDNRQRVSLEQVSRHFKVKGVGDTRIVKLTLERPLPGKRIAKIVPSDLDCESPLECIILFKQEKILTWHSRKMKTSCKKRWLKGHFSFVYAQGFETVPGILSSAALFDRKDRLAGILYENDKMQNAEKTYTCAWAYGARIHHKYISASRRAGEM